MWSDSETSRDFLNFSGVAETVAEIVVQADGQPVSVGISGAWGVGKSSMIELTAAALEQRSSAPTEQNASDAEAAAFVFVRFNAWLYQGYDDARAALVDVIVKELAGRAETTGITSKSLASLAKRVRWLRVAKAVGPSAVSMMLGLGPLGLAGAALGQVRKLASGEADGETVEELGDNAEAAQGKLSEFVAPEEDRSPPEQIQELRDSFEKTLEELDITLVVLIDDLDRCLPETTVSTLEAIRLFLFLKRTAFVIAADDDMIKHAVRRHFGEQTEERLITSYFDKLVQVPIRVPPLGTQEVRAYLMLLFVENSSMPERRKELVRRGVMKTLKEAWRGERVDLAGVVGLCGEDLSDELRSQLEMAEQLTPLMTRARGIAGNPRLIKRFLNALSIRMSMSRAQQVDVNEAELAKLLLFERLGTLAAYDELVAAVTADPEGMPRTLLTSLEAEPESAAERGAAWEGPFVADWLKLAPPLAEADLRGALYVSREYAPVLTPTDGISSQGVEVLDAVLGNPGLADSLHDDLHALAPRELSHIMTELLRRATSITSWGAPPVLTDCLAIAAIDDEHGRQLARFLAGRPPAQIEPSIVRRIEGRTWTEDVFSAWRSGAISEPVRRAIDQVRGDGHIPV